MENQWAALLGNWISEMHAKSMEINENESKMNEN